jgi:hypothetical protein
MMAVEDEVEVENAAAAVADSLSQAARDVKLWALHAINLHAFAY